VKIINPAMKETVKINLNQRLFDLDEDAYKTLKTYLDSLRKYFEKRPGEAEEILQDIEQRIAEILEQKLSSNKQVITIADIEETIGTMGTVDDITREAEDSEQQDFNTDDADEKKSTADDYNREYRRLHRDLESNILGGVCSGMAAFFNIDPVWIRLAFVLLLIANGIGLLVYLILWAAVPAARTTAQRLQMRGRPVTVENIQESVKSEYERVKDSFNKYSQSESFKRTRDTVNEVFTTFGQIFLAIIKIILIVIGVAMAIVLITLLLGFFGVIAAGWNFHTWQLPDIPFREHIGPMFHDITFFSIALLLVIMIPAVAILGGIIKLIFNVKTHYSVLSAFAWTIWSLALVFLIISVISGKDLINNSYKEKDEVILNINKSKPLYINIYDTILPDWKMGYYTFFGHEIIRNKINEKCYLKPSIYINTSDDSSMRMIIEKSSSILSFDDNIYSNYQYNWDQTDTTIILDNYFSIHEEDLWQLPGINVYVLVPEGKEIFIDKDLKELIKPIENGNYSVLEYNTRLIMKNNRLEPVIP
jgi:phage shock protein PspC (stress-responsive transcriptional regulator)